MTNTDDLNQIANKFDGDPAFEYVSVSEDNGDITVRLTRRPKWPTPESIGEFMAQTTETGTPNGRALFAEFAPDAVARAIRRDPVFKAAIEWAKHCKAMQTKTVVLEIPDPTPIYQAAEELDLL